MIIQYNINPDAVEVLRRIQGRIPEAIVAGGCLRDWLMRKPVNDIDLFVPYEKGLLAASLLSDTHPTCTKVIPEPYLTFNRDVRDVRYYTGDDGVPPVNIISVSGDCSPEAQLERFDFGICRVAFDGERLWKDLAFDRDQRDHTFSLMVNQSNEQKAYSMARYERLLTKYPEWKFVDRTGFDF